MRLKRAPLILAITGLSVGAILYVFLSTDWSRQGAPITLTPEDATIVAQGESVYSDQCASCHKADLSGEPDWQQRNEEGMLPAPPHDETGHTWHHPDRVLFELTKYGPSAMAGGDYKSNMPAYEGVLSDDEIVAVLSYIKSQWPEAIRERHDATNARAPAE